MSDIFYTSVVALSSGLISGVFIAAMNYFLTRKKEREAEWRKEKLLYYKNFIESMNGIIIGDSTDEGQRAFSQTCNNLLLFAPQYVIDAITEFRDEIKSTNPTPLKEKHDHLLNRLLLAIRKDIGIYPADEESTFHAVLWATGCSKREIKTRG